MTELRLDFDSREIFRGEERITFCPKINERNYDIDLLKDAKIYWPMQGANIILYYTDKWNMSSRRMINCEENVYGGSRTFADIFRSCGGYDFVEPLSKDMSHHFVICDKENKLNILSSEYYNRDVALYVGSFDKNYEKHMFIIDELCFKNIYEATTPIFALKTISLDEVQDAFDDIRFVIAETSRGVFKIKDKHYRSSNCVTTPAPSCRWRVGCSACRSRVRATLCSPPSPVA